MKLKITRLNGTVETLEVAAFAEVKDPLENIPQEIDLGYKARSGETLFETVHQESFLALIKRDAQFSVIHAVKLLRCFVPLLGLKEAKELVESLVNAPEPGTCICGHPKNHHIGTTASCLDADCNCLRFKSDEGEFIEDETLTLEMRCKCDHMRSEHREGTGCIHRNLSGRICDCWDFEPADEDD